MKLSEAILTAATKWPQCYGLSSCVVDGVEQVCPWEGAMRVAGLQHHGDQYRYRIAVSRISVSCPLCLRPITYLSTIVTHLGDAHRLPFAVIAGLVRELGVDVELPVGEAEHVYI